MSSKLEYPGLSEAEVRASREKYGENVLTPPARTPMWKLFLEKFSDPIIRILLVALLLSIAVAVYHVATGEAGMSALFEPAGIALAILLATVVGFLFEMSAARKFDILNQVNDDQPVKVVRGGHILEIPKRDVVVGDIVMLNAGDEIPADGILLSAVSVQVNESSLTGEPMATKTTVEADFDKEATYPSNAVMNGSTMLGGYGVMRVTQVGDATEYGKVYTGSQIENNTQTPLDKQLNTLASFITKASYVIAAIILIARTAIYLSDHPVLDWLSFGSYLLSTAMIAVTVIVVAVPEGLPMSVTLSLAMSMKRMLANNNLVRKMHACETMGAATVICTDKTGTLTQNQMRVSEADFAYAADSNTKEIIYEGIAANSTAHLDEGGQRRDEGAGQSHRGSLAVVAGRPGCRLRRVAQPGACGGAAHLLDRAQIYGYGGRLAAAQTSGSLCERGSRVCDELLLPTDNRAGTCADGEQPSRRGGKTVAIPESGHAHTGLCLCAGGR